MGNALRDWGAAATLAGAALLQAGCRDSGNDDLSKAAYPVVRAPELDLDAAPMAMKDVLKKKAIAEEQPTATPQENIGQGDSEVTSDVMVAEIDGKKTEPSVSPKYAAQANEKLFGEYTAALEKLQNKKGAATALLLAEHDFNQTKEKIIELGALSPPEYSDEDVEKIRSFLIRHQSYFTIAAQVYSRASKGYGPIAIDENYPDLSLSADRSVLTFTIVLSTTDGGPEAIKIPHTIRVSIELTKQGAKRHSVIIENPFPADKGNFHTDLYADRCISIFGERTDE